MNLTKFTFWKYQPYSVVILNEAVEQPYCLAKNIIFILKMLILPVYILTNNVQGLFLYTKCYFKIIKVVL